MTKGKFSAGVILILAWSSAFAQPGRTDDGCALLARLVQNSVHLAATQFSPDRPRRHQELRTHRVLTPVVARRQVCARTTEVASRAFRLALVGFNMSIRWNGPMNPGDHCFSFKLSECYPGWEPGNPIPTNRLAFAYDAWKGVRRALESQMPFGSASGVSQFTAASLDAALSARLSESVDGPLYSSYQRSGVSAGPTRDARRRPDRR